MTTYNEIKSDVVKLVSKVNLTFVLAFLIESPRLVLGFHAIRESPLFAIPLSILIAYSASVSWELYFENRKRYLLLVLNIFQLISAVITIAPVLYYCAKYLNLDVDLKQVIPPSFEWFIYLWVTVLALSTFLPLIVLAAVNSYKKLNKVVETVITEKAIDTNEIINALKNDLMESIRNEFNARLTLMQQEFNNVNQSVLQSIKELNNKTDTKQAVPSLKEVTTVNVPTVISNDNQVSVSSSELENKVIECLSNQSMTIGELSRCCDVQYGKLLQRKPDGKVYGVLAKMMKDGAVIEVEKNKFSLVEK